MLCGMFESLRSRLLLAVGAAAVLAVTITGIISFAVRPAPKKKGPDGVAAWKARTGVDLAALPRLHPPRPDSEEARALDALLQPLDLRLCGRLPERRPPDDGPSPDDDAPVDLRETLRGAIRATTTEAPKFSPAVVSLIEEHAGTLDAVAGYVETHGDIRWREDFDPRPGSSTLYISDHLAIHRLLIGRGFLALERKDPATAARMLATSQKLNRVLQERRELDAQFIATGIERLQLALMRRAGSALDAVPAEPALGLRERYVSAMSGEAALILANLRPDASKNRDGDDVFFRGLLAPELRAASNEALALAAKGVDEIRRSPDGCAELAKKRPMPSGMLAENFYMLNATEAWRRFQVLALDRAITAAVLTGRTTSPCPSVAITVRDDGKTRIVEAKGLPDSSENVIALPPLVTARLNP